MPSASIPAGVPTSEHCDRFAPPPIRTRSRRPPNAPPPARCCARRRSTI
jgi:hypothetical protein